MDGLEIAEIVVLEVQTEAEIQTSVSSIDNLEVTELVEQERRRRGLSSPYVCMPLDRIRCLHICTGVPVSHLAYCSIAIQHHMAYCIV